MRISVDKRDPAFHPMAYDCNVLLDGERLTSCITADEERGEAICLQRDEQGRLVVADNSVVIQTLRGKVEVLCSEQIRKEITRC